VPDPPTERSIAPVLAVQVAFVTDSFIVMVAAARFTLMVLVCLQPFASVYFNSIIASIKAGNVFSG
jgi:hypothetical protein